HFAGNSLPVLSVPGFGAHSPRWFFAPASALPAIIPPQEELYRDAAMDSRSRVGPTGQPRPDPGPTQRPATLGGYLGHGTNARPAGPGEAARDTGGSARRPHHHPADRRCARVQQSDGPHDGAYQHRRTAPARPPVERVRWHGGRRRNGAYSPTGA